jgi:hypothetical protein
MAKPRPKKKPARPIVAYEPKGYEPKKIVQRIHAEDLFERIPLDPKYVPWFYVDNIIQRVFARTYGQGPIGPVPIKCNEEGALFVAGVGGAYTRNEVKFGAAPDAYGAAIEFSVPMGRVDIFTLDNKMLLVRSRDNVVWDDEIFLFKDSFYSIDCVTFAFKVQNFAAGLVANYRVIGWY